jgi:hypothetical protein
MESKIRTSRKSSDGTNTGGILIHLVDGTRKALLLLEADLG